MRYIQVILPLKIDWEPFYSTTDESVGVGSRVSVRFASRQYVGVVSAVDVQPNIEQGKVQPVIRHESSIEPIPGNELKLWRFVSEYYLCTIGEVYKAAYPRQKISSEMTRSRVKERREASQAKVVASIEKRIERLKGTLERAEAELAKSSREDIRMRRKSRTDRIAGELEAARMSLDAVRERALSQGSRKIENRRKPDIPTLLLCEDWAVRAGRICEEIEKTLSAGGDVLLLAPGKTECSRFSGLLSQRLKESFPAWKDSVTLGTRAALFDYSPYLSLIVVDQEQDRTYKQDAAPLFNSRDVAVYMGALCGAKVILGSDSPTLESISNCRNGKYRLETIAVEHKSEVEAVSIPSETAKRGMVGLFSRKLIEAINETEGPITIVRGFEKEEDVQSQIENLFPGRDNFRILTAYSCRRDEQKSSLTAVLQADVFFAKDDFRADERALQDLQHLKQNCSRLFIQTYNLKRDIFERIVAGNAFDYETMLMERQEFGMPPYTKLIDVAIDDENEKRRTFLTHELMRDLIQFSPLGPMTNPYQPSQLRLRIILERSKNTSGLKRELQARINSFEKSRRYDGHVRLDVDPV